MGKAIGIDLGTTNTAVAVMVDGRPRVIEDDKGYKVLPSVVSLKPGGDVLVGQAARSLALTAPERTIYAIKRLMGRRFDSPEVARVRKRVGYDILPADDGGVLVRMAGETWTPTQVSALVLQHAKRIAERALDETVDEAVITVPAYFNHAQRSATFEAAQLAGLRCERLLNEPTAAALAYGFRKDINRTILIYDLGGGTFDVSVLQLSKGVYEVLATAGETFLGGEDFDYRMADHLAENFMAAHGMDPREERASMQRLKDASERAKCELSFTDRTTVLIPRITENENLELAVTRLTLEGLVEDLVEKSIQITRQAVADAGLRIQDIEDVILVGGQTRMPRVREAIGSLFQKEPSRSVHPEEVVAIGAAVHAHSLVAPDASKPLLLDVTPFDLGIDVAGGLFQPIITKNSHVPASAGRTFATAHDNQDNVQVTVRQGESRFAAENEFLGRFVMTGLTPAPRMTTKVEVTFRIDSNGMLHVAAVEPSTGERKRITIRNYAEVAQGGGKIEARIEGDDAGGLSATAPDGVVQAPGEETAPAAAQSRGIEEKKGLLSRIFGKKPARGAPGAASQPAAASADEPATRILESSDPDRPPLYAVDEPQTTDVIEADHIEALEPEPITPEPLDEEAGEYLGGLAPLDDDEPLPAIPVEEDESGEMEPVSLDPSIPGELVPLDEVDGGFVPMDEPPRPARGDSFAKAFDQTDDDPFSFDDPFAESPAAASEPEEDPFGFDPFADEPTIGPGSDTTHVAPVEGPAAALSTWHDGASNAWDAQEDDEPEEVTDPGFRPAPAQEDPPLPDDAFGEDLFPLSDDALGPPDEDTVIGPPPADDGFSLPDDDDLAAALAEAAAEVAAPARPAPVRAPEPVQAAPAEEPRRRKPARLKLAYPRADAMVSEYRENLRRGGCFIRTEKPLTVGRECQIEVRAPGLDEPIQLEGIVTWSSAGQNSLAPGQAPGMGIEYRLDEASRQAVEEALARLSA